jgi:HAD superfamily hydrolase (TIGR01509 family)
VTSRYPVYLFDVDGTLVDSADDICGAILEALKPTRVCGLGPSDLVQYVGVHLLHMFQELLPEYTPEQHEELIRTYRTTYSARGHRSTRVFPGVTEALQGLGGRKATATTKATSTTRAVLEQFGLAPYFDHVQGTDGFAYKPAPDVVLASLAALGARPEECLLVGDSPADMEAGRRAGVAICAVRYGYGDPVRMARFEPDLWISDMRELLG